MKKQFRMRLNDSEGVWYVGCLADIAKLLDNKRYSVEVRLVCKHLNTFIDGGIKICKDCGDQLEVTSWRD